MQLDHLKKGLFGYRKESVFRCIAAAEEEFSKKLLEKDAQAQKAAEEYQRRIQVLEQALEALQQEQGQRQSQQAVIADTLLDAQNHAAGLRKQTEQTEQQLLRQMEEQALKQRQELLRYQETIRRLRGEICTMLSAMDEKAQEMESQVEETLHTQPVRSMTLFERKAEPVA